MKLQVTNGGLQVSCRKRAVRGAFNLQPSTFNLLHAFTLVEMLVVISILGILAALTVPALKNLGKSDATISASRQLLDGIGRARQLAMANRTTVYMVFVPTNFWLTSSSTWTNSLTPAQLTAAVNLCDKQLTGYNFVSHGTLGDQPGQHAWRYLAPWQNLPDGTFIALWKFAMSGNQSNRVTDAITGQYFDVAGFATNGIPLPTATNSLVSLPCVAFNYLGQLTLDGENLAGRDEYIPLAQGSVVPAMDGATKALTFNSPSVLETPPGNSTNISYNIVHIDALTGRAVLEHHKMQ
jgi:prepilin-type N-terminal cleavage/methylation domain-containing protein